MSISPEASHYKEPEIPHLDVDQAGTKKQRKENFGSLNPEQAERFVYLREFFVNRLDAGKSKDPAMQKLVEEYRDLVGKFLTVKTETTPREQIN